MVDERTQELFEELRNRGCAVCVFQPVDVVKLRWPNANPDDRVILAMARDWLVLNRQQIESDMIEGGWKSIQFCVDWEGVR
jgi:hypothetical protein